MADRSAGYELCNCDQALDLQRRLGLAINASREIVNVNVELREMLAEANKEITNLKRALDWSTKNVERLQAEALLLREPCGACGCPETRD